MKRLAPIIILTTLLGVGSSANAMIQRKARITAPSTSAVTNTDPEAGPVDATPQGFAANKADYQAQAIEAVFGITKDKDPVVFWSELTDAQRTVMHKKFNITSLHDLITYAEKEYQRRQREKYLKTCCKGTMILGGVAVAAGLADPALEYLGINTGTSRTLRYGMLFKFGISGAKGAYHYFVPSTQAHQHTE